MGGVELLRFFERAPLRTARWEDVAGNALVATRAQTIFDLVSGRIGAVSAGDAAEAVRTLIPHVSREELADITGRAQRVPAAVSALLNEWHLDA
jgi:hypothetical protein